jgi:hypothetical protein
VINIPQKVLASVTVRSLNYAYISNTRCYRAALQPSGDRYHEQLIALGTLLFTFNAAAGCPSAVPAKDPEIPNGAAASEQSMFDAMALSGHMCRPSRHTLIAAISP